MDPRSIKPGLSAVSHPLFMVHPLTGEMITPLGYSKDGRPCWPMMGGAPDDDDKGDKDDDKGEDDDDEDDDESEDDDEDNDDEDSDDDDDDDSEDGKKKKKGNAQAKIKALTEEKDRHYRKAKKATKRAEAAEAEVAALKAKYESGDDDEDDDKGKKGNKGKSDKPKIDDSKIRAAEAKAERLAIENAFLRVNEVKWIKPEQALALMMADDDYEIEFDDDGKVDRKALRAELKRFAKANPHLVQKAAPKDDKDADEDEGAQRATASRMNGKRKGSRKSDKEMSREELAKKFPALANRL